VTMFEFTSRRLRWVVACAVSGTRVAAGFGKRRSRLLLVVLIAAVFAFPVLDAHPCQAKLHSGFVLIWPGPAFDFSDSVLVAPPNGDLYWVTLSTTRSIASGEGSSQFAWFTTNYPALIAYAPGDSAYDELTTASSDTTLYHFDAAVLSYQVYVVRTKEHHYAKVRVEMIGGGGITIEYTYQDDGSRVLARPVAVRPSTWGTVKGLYR